MADIVQSHFSYENFVHPIDLAMLAIFLLRDKIALGLNK